ncbi:hypothetical protein EON66_08310 [archaeon]|nr:MAG: hypothetical protein EON66_08310 [archaeon]
MCAHGRIARARHVRPPVQYLAMKSMNPEVMPVLLTATGLACSVFWGLYGIFNGDWFVLGPNAAGVGLSIIQLILAFYINIAVKRNPSLRKYAPLDGADTEQANLALYGQESMSYSSSSHAERLV